MKDDAMCVCGHPAIEHHRSWFRGGGMLVEECETYGYNETGGMEQVNGKWVDHCQRFRLACKVSVSGNCLAVTMNEPFCAPECEEQ